LNEGLSLTGEGPKYYAAGRLHWLARRLAHIDESPERVLDFGCGIGSATPHIRDALGPAYILGLDVSQRSIDEAQRRHGSRQVEFLHSGYFVPTGDFDLVFTNGVFHHIPPEERPESLQLIRDALRPSGVLAFWENNPWNPGTRYVMSRIPFDRDAQMLFPHSARRLLCSAGFDIILTDFAFIFPAGLRRLRFLERPLCKLPIGGQYLILARRSD
jgi:SAM-dependent methyltransferase